MAKRVQIIGHATSSADAFEGLSREITVDTTKNTLRVHDGTTPGGHETAKADLSNTPAATGANLGHMTAAQASALTTAVSNIATHETRLDQAEIDIAAVEAAIAGLGDLAALDQVAAAQIANNAVETAKILDGNVTYAKIAAAAKTDTGSDVHSATASKLLTAAGARAAARIGGNGYKEIGEVYDYAGTTAPNGSLFCDGASLLRTSYTALFAVIGTTYGAADGTHFNIPDIRGRVVAGQDDMGGVSANRLTSPLNGDTLGATGGTESHTHGAGTLVAASAAVAQKDVADGGEDAANMVHGHTITGSTAADSSIQPTIILNKCIFTGVFS